MALALLTLGLPVSPDLFWIYDAGGGKTRRGAGRLAGDPAFAALPSVSPRGIRSRSL